MKKKFDGFTIERTMWGEANTTHEQCWLDARSDNFLPRASLWLYKNGQADTLDITCAHPISESDAALLERMKEALAEEAKALREELYPADFQDKQLAAA